ncbi:ATP-binding protein [Saccharopolyspora shandongensis]
MTTRQWPYLRRQLTVRLLIGTILVAVCSISATAWLASQSTTGAIRAAQGEALAGDKDIYNTLVGFAATHATWADVDPVVRDLAQRTNRRVSLTTRSGELIAASDNALQSPPGAAQIAVVDPLTVDAKWAADPPAGGIDPRATGPFHLPAQDRRYLTQLADQTAACLGRNGFHVRVVAEPTGRPRLDGVAKGIKMPGDCVQPELDQPTATENAALDQLNVAFGTCLASRGREPLRLGFDQDVRLAPPDVVKTDPVAADCLYASRRDQLRPLVAPPALLFTADPAAAGSDLSLSKSGALRIAGLALVVLLVAVAVSMVLTARLIRPLRTAFTEMSADLERTERQRNAMVSDVSHELRTPLSTIRGYLEATQDGVKQLDEALISSLHEEALQLQHIVDDLQDLALAEAGRLRLNPRVVDLSDLLTQIAETHRRQAAEAGVSLTVQLSDDVVLIADPVRLRQVVGNLASNALRHTPSGGQVGISAAQDGDDAVIEVADSGVGIDADDIPHVFDRFWRAEKSRNRATGGSGLGLAIVRNLVQAHGGTVTVTSALGHGSTFTVRIPREHLVLS